MYEGVSPWCICGGDLEAEAALRVVVLHTPVLHVPELETAPEEEEEGKYA